MWFILEVWIEFNFPQKLLTCCLLIPKWALDSVSLQGAKGNRGRKRKCLSHKFRNRTQKDIDGCTNTKRKQTQQNIVYMYTQENTKIAIYISARTRVRRQSPLNPWEKRSNSLKKAQETTYHPRLVLIWRSPEMSNKSNFTYENFSIVFLLDVANMTLPET